MMLLINKVTHVKNVMVERGDYGNGANVIILNPKQGTFALASLSELEVKDLIKALQLPEET